MQTALQWLFGRRGSIKGLLVSSVLGAVTVVGVFAAWIAFLMFLMFDGDGMEPHYCWRENDCLATKTGLATLAIHFFLLIISIGVGFKLKRRLARSQLSEQLHV